MAGSIATLSVEVRQVWWRVIRHARELSARVWSQRSHHIFFGIAPAVFVDMAKAVDGVRRR